MRLPCGPADFADAWPPTFCDDPFEADEVKGVCPPHLPPQRHSD